MGSAAGLVVEFVGLPGAGKSALSRQVATLLRERGTTLSEPTQALDRATTLRRSLVKASLGVEAAVAAPLTSARWIRTFVGMAQRRPADIGRVTLNWLFLAGLTRRLASRPGVHLLDQGVLQGLWSAGYAAKRGGLGHEAGAALAKALLPGTLVIVVDTSPATLRHRLQHRPGGDSRLERDLAAGDPAGSLARAVAAFASLQELLVLLERQGRIVVMRVEGEHPELLQRTAERVADRIDAAARGQG